MKKVLFAILLLLFGATIYLAIIYEQHSVTLSEPTLTQQCHFEPEMVLVKGGSFEMGAGAQYQEELPIISQVVDDFYIDKYEVTNAEFAQFVDETGYKTIAERKPNPADYPNIPADQLVPGSAVFVQLDEAVKATSFLNWWQFKEGAYWKAPLGPGSSIEGKESFPVIHIAYEDAKAYADWKGHRLPTEAEFEYAIRGGLKDKKYALGDTLKFDGEHQANTWQGLFPFSDTAEDGFVGLAPVGCYQPNNFGLYDTIGNVWEWTQSTYYPRHFTEESKPSNLPPNGYDHRQPGVSVGVVKGGSYLCAPDFCARYRPAARHAQDTGMGTSHIGFRTVKDVVVAQSQ